MPLDYVHDPWLVAASLLLALMAGFTGLLMTRELSARTAAWRCWSLCFGPAVFTVHFVAVAGASFLPSEGHYTRVYTAAGQNFCA